ncbi:MAG: radical SAM protein [Ideonella sp.]|nr:radical SAM protein [Ideonella sp.]
MCEPASRAADRGSTVGPASAAAPAPRIVSWNLTRVCNLACAHCYLDAVQRRSEASDELSTGEALRVVAEVGALAPGALLVLTGGEPLLRRDLDRIVAAAAAADLMPVVGSNGVLLTSTRAAALRAAGAFGVGISIDSVTPRFHDRLRGLPGAWRRAVGGVHAARDAGLGVLLQATLFEDNRADLAGFVALARDAGAMALNFFFLVCTGRGVTQTDLSGAQYEAALAEIARLQAAHPELMIRARCAPYARRMLGLHAGEGDALHANWSSACLAGRSYLRITPAGAVTVCPYIARAEGSLREATLERIWREGVGFVRLRGELPHGKCGRCDWRVSCGGCRARALAAAGDLMAEDDKCAYVPAADALPEPASRVGQPVATLPATAQWTAPARALLDRIPGFVRARVRERVEHAAKAAALEAITPEFMLAQRPRAVALAERPAQAAGPARPRAAQGPSPRG